MERVPLFLLWKGQDYVTRSVIRAHTERFGGLNYVP
jgi:hypothetical protein